MQFNDNKDAILGSYSSSIVSGSFLKQRTFSARAVSTPSTHYTNLQTHAAVSIRTGIDFDTDPRRLHGIGRLCRIVLGPFEGPIENVKGMT
jgi:hypothetical protein